MSAQVNSFNKLVAKKIDSSSSVATLSLAGSHRNSLAEKTASRIRAALELTNAKCVVEKDGLVTIREPGEFGVSASITVNSKELTSPRVYSIPKSFGFDSKSPFSHTYRETLDKISEEFRVRNGPSGNFREISRGSKDYFYEAVLEALRAFIHEPYLQHSEPIAAAFRHWTQGAEIIALAQSKDNEVRLFDLRGREAPTSMKATIVSASRMEIQFDNQIKLQARVHNAASSWTAQARIPVKISFEILDA